MRAIGASIGCGLLLLAAGPAPAQTGAERSPNPRPELARFAEVLDIAVRQVSRPSPYQVLGPVAAGSSYLLPGYGAVFVLPARALPSEGEVIVVHEGAPGSEPVVSVWRRDARRVPRTKERAPAPPQPALPDFDREIQQIEGLVEAYSREAERASRDAERAFEAVEQAMRVRIRELEGAPPAPAVPQTPPAAPSGPVPVVAPAAPAPPAAGTPPALAVPPPWRFWYQAEAHSGDPRPAERVVADVKGALIQALETRGAGLTVVRPDDFVVVAVDFSAQGFPFRMQRRADRTLVVKARKRDLDERRAGRLAAEELRKRIEALEY
jgi:hypothetical protein